MDTLTDISKFLSYILRHAPQSIGLHLDQEGWAIISELIHCAKKFDHPLDYALIHSVVINSDKKRFTISRDGSRIRAAQGHSTDSVMIAYAEKIPPEILYHGTAARFLASILHNGLRSGSRQYVHLSEDVDTANTVGQRYGKPVVLKIEALRMHQQGFKFFQAGNGVWLTKQVSEMFLIQN